MIGIRAYVCVDFRTLFKLMHLSSLGYANRKSCLQLLNWILLFCCSLW